MQYVSLGLFAVTFIALSGLYFPPPRHTPQAQLPVREKLASLDYPGYFLLVASLCLFLTGTTYGGIIGWRDAQTLGPLCVGIAIGIAFAIYEWKGTQTGLLHHDMFRHRNFPVALFAMACEGLVFFAILAFVPVAAAAL